VITWVIVFLALVLTLSIVTAPIPSGVPNAPQAAPSSTTTTSRAATPLAVQTVTVAAVADGRTIIGSDGAQVVVEGLDQPGQCWAEAALTFAKTTLLGKQVRVDAEVARRLPDGEDVAVLMASRGFGRTKAGARTAISDAQEMAKTAKLGLWGAPCDGSDEPLPPPATTTSVPPPPEPTTATAHYEAESSPAVCTGKIDTNWPGFTGSGFCNSDNEVGAYAQFTVTSSTAGSATVVVRFANGGTDNRTADILVNGTTVQSVSFEVTGAWSTWASKTLTIPLPAGSSTIRLDATNSDGLPNLDHVDVTTH
jgi:endonuclease YncB( thermonuclease family)